MVLDPEVEAMDPNLRQLLLVCHQLQLQLRVREKKVVRKGVKRKTKKGVRRNELQSILHADNNKNKPQLK